MGYILSFRELLTVQVNHVPRFLMCWLLVNLWVGEDCNTCPLSVFIMGFLGGSVVKHPPASAGDPGSIPGSGRSCCRRKWHPTPGFFPGKSHGQRSLVGYSPWAHKESDTTEHTHMPVVSQFSCSAMSNSLRPQDCSTPGFPVHHQLPKLAQTRVHPVGDAIQPSHPLL